MQTEPTYTFDEVMERIGIYMRNEDWDCVIMLWDLVKDEMWMDLYNFDEWCMMERGFLFAKKVFENKD